MTLILTILLINFQLPYNMLYHPQCHYQIWYISFEGHCPGLQHIYPPWVSNFTLQKLLYSLNFTGIGHCVVYVWLIYLQEPEMASQPISGSLILASVSWNSVMALWIDGGSFQDYLLHLLEVFMHCTTITLYWRIHVL